MDLALPVLDGWEATRRIKAGGRTSGIPVIGLSAHAMADDEEKARRVGCDDFDTKPVELPRLPREDRGAAVAPAPAQRRNRMRAETSVDARLENLAAIRAFIEDACRRGPAARRVRLFRPQARRRRGLHATSSSTATPGRAGGSIAIACEADRTTACASRSSTRGRALRSRGGVRPRTSRPAGKTGRSAGWAGT